MRYRVDRRQIAFIKFIFEAYEGIAVLSTLDPVKGIVQLKVAPGCDSVAHCVIEDLSQKVLIEPLPAVEERTSKD